MNRLASMLPEYPVVVEQYGIGTAFAPQLMVEIGDARRFIRKQALVAFAGVDTSPNDSSGKRWQQNHEARFCRLYHQQL